MELEGLYRQLRGCQPHPWDWPLPAVALAAPSRRWQEAALMTLLRRAEERSGGFEVVPWQRTEPGGMDSRRHLPPRVLLLTAGDGLAAAAEALAMGIPFLALCPGNHPLGQLARDSGRGRQVDDALAGGDLLAAWLQTGEPLEQKAQQGAAFLQQLTG